MPALPSLEQRRKGWLSDCYVWGLDAAYYESWVAWYLTQPQTAPVQKLLALAREMAELSNEYSNDLLLKYLLSFNP